MIPIIPEKGDLATERNGPVHGRTIADSLADGRLVLTSWLMVMDQSNSPRVGNSLVGLTRFVFFSVLGASSGTG
jgi:hypothetical protein